MKGGVVLSKVGIVLACLLRLDPEGFGRAAVGEGVPALMAANRDLMAGAAIDQNGAAPQKRQSKR